MEEAFCYCIIKDIVDDIDGTLKENGGKVIVGSMPKIYSISVHIKQIMQNLIDNSLKYYQKDLPPIVNISSVQANDDDTENGLDSGEIQIIVEDNEIGFDEKHADSIFQPFRRFHGKSQFKGTGLGLATVKKIVDYHKGRIFVKSQKGQGATFTVVLPKKNR